MKREERRFSKRKNISGSVFFEKGGASGGRARNEGGLLDIGAGGVSFLSDRKLRKGSVCRIFLPMSEDVMVPTLAEVMWTARDDDGYRVGARFLI